MRAETLSLIKFEGQQSDANVRKFEFKGKWSIISGEFLPANFQPVAVKPRIKFLGRPRTPSCFGTATKRSYHIAPSSE